jgi:hypothetical protein
LRGLEISELKEEDMPMVLALKAKRFERELTIAIKQTNSFWEVRMYNK